MFDQSLTRLRNAADNRQHGVPEDRCFIDREDLQKLLFHFDRLDREARSHHEVLVGGRGDWMQTFTGRKFWILDPRPEDIDIVDIARALSKQCRYAGHCLRFYSVAEHSVHLARAASPDVAFEALMDDSPEAYLVDLIRPSKPAFPQYAAIENRIKAAIAARFGFVVASA